MFIYVGVIFTNAFIYKSRRCESTADGNLRGAGVPRIPLAWEVGFRRLSFAGAGMAVTFGTTSLNLEQFMCVVTWC